VEYFSDEESSYIENEELSLNTKRRRKRRMNKAIRRSSSASEMSGVLMEKEIATASSDTNVKEESKLNRTFSSQEKELKQQDSKLTSFSKKANKALGRLWNPYQSPKEEAVTSPRKENKKEENQKQRKRSSEKNTFSPRPGTPRY